MQFQNPLASGIYLVREAFRSPNYVAGSAGWTVNADGTAEFSNIVARGDITAEKLFTGAVPPRVSIWNDPGVGPVIQFETGDPRELSPGGIIMVGNGINPPTAQMSGPQIVVGPAGAPPMLTMDSPDGVSPGVIFWSGASGTIFRISSILQTILDGVLRLTSVTDASLVSTDHPFQIGLTSGRNIIIDNNEIMARDNSGASTLALNAEGGGVTAPDMRHVVATDNTGLTSVVTAYNSLASTAAVTLPITPSGTVTVNVHGILFNSAANNTFMSFEIRDTNAAGAVLFAASDGRAGRINGVTPTSAGITYTVTGLPTNVPLYIRAMFRTAAGTGNWNTVSISALPSP